MEEIKEPKKCEICGVELTEENCDDRPNASKRCINCLEEWGDVLWPDS